MKESLIQMSIILNSTYPYMSHEDDGYSMSAPFFWNSQGEMTLIIYICKIRVAHVYNHNVVIEHVTWQTKLNISLELEHSKSQKMVHHSHILCIGPFATSWKLLPALPSCFAISFPGGTTLCRWWAWRIILVDEKYFLNYLQWTNVLTIVVKQQVEKKIPLYHHRLVGNLFARTIRNFCRLPGTKTFLGNIHRVIKDFSK